MADDETANGDKAAAPGPHVAPGNAVVPSKARSPGDREAASEWTVSDSRGPLGRADEDEPGKPSAFRPDGQDDHVGDHMAEPVDHAQTTTEASDPGNAEPVAPQSSPAAETGAGPETESASAGHTTPVPEPAVAEAPTRSVWPIAAGLIVGAIIGAGSAAVIDGTYVGSSTPDAQVASLAARVDALEKRPDAAALKTSVADLDRKVAALQGGAKTASSAGAASPGPQASPPLASSGNDLAPLQKQVADLQAQVEALKGRGAESRDLQSKIAALETTIAGMKKDASSAQAGVESVEGQQKTIATQQKLLADKVMVPALAVVADSLVQQIDGGEPYATQVAALETLGADPVKIAILKQNADHGVLSAKALAARFAPLAEPISAIAHKAPANAGFMDRLKSGMFSMVSVRSVDDTGGTDLPSRVARIKADLAHDDVADALSTWNALPEDAKGKGQDWSLLAKAHAEAMGAARALQHDAIVALGAKKS